MNTAYRLCTRYFESISLYLIFNQFFRTSLQADDPYNLEIVPLFVAILMHFGKKRDLFQYSHEMVHSRWTYTGRLNECIGGYISGESSFLVHCGLLLLSHRQARPCSASFPVRKISFHIIVSNSLVVRQSLWIAILRSHGSPLAILLHRKMKAIKPCRAIALREISFLELVCRY